MTSNDKGAVRPQGLDYTVNAGTAAHTTSSGRDINNITWEELSVPRFIVACSVLAVIENIPFYPFHLIKTREQVDRTRLTSAKDHWNATKSQVRDAWKQGKIRGLYKGFWTSAIGYIPCYATYMLTYSYTKHFLGWAPESHRSHDKWKAFYIPLVSGVVADAASIVLYVPADVIVQRIQVKNSPFSNGIVAARHILAEEGVRGLYRGTGATLAYSACGSAIWWATYENAKMRFLDWSRDTTSTDGQNDRKILPQVGAGFVSGSLTTTLTNPLDVVKTRLQVQTRHLADMSISNSKSAMAGSKDTVYQGVIHALKVILHEEGMTAFTKGLLPKIASRAPLSALTAFIYELMFYASRKEPVVTSYAR